MIPGATPLNELASALLGVAVNPPANLLVQLREDERGLLRAVNSILPAGDNSELVLVIDQFEEVFTLLDSETERTHLLNSLLTAVNDPSSRLRLIVTLRADFYDRPLLYPDFGNLMRMRTEVVLPLSASELRQAIVGPAERIGMTLEPGLVDAIVSDVGEQPGALPLLQYALTELFERRQGHTLALSAYRESGGVLGALARRADELYVNLDGAGREAVRQVFLRLVPPGEGTEDTRRRVQLPELTSVASGKQVIQDVIDTFGRYRLLTFDRDPQTRVPTVEVAHEALIRTWERLRAWLSESREDLRMQRRLAASVTEWLNSKRDRSFLASGTRLDQFGTWAAETTLSLNADEQAYLDASAAERNAQRAEEEARRTRTGAGTPFAQPAANAGRCAAGGDSRGAGPQRTRRKSAADRRRQRQYRHQRAGASPQQREHGNAGARSGAQQRQELPSATRRPPLTRRGRPSITLKPRHWRRGRPSTTPRLPSATRRPLPTRRGRPSTMP